MSVIQEEPFTELQHCEQSWRRREEDIRNVQKHISTQSSEKSFQRCRIDICQEIRDMNWEEF